MVTNDHVTHRTRRKLVIPRFRNLIIAAVFISSALVSIYILRYDYVLQLTSNYHWYALVGFAAVDLIIALQLVLTGLLRVWDKIVLRIAGFWAFTSLLAVIADVFVGLQLPQGYPSITTVQAFQYLFLGINGNVVPSGTSALFTLYVIAIALCLLPSNRFWFNWATLPTWRTVLAVLMIALIVMGLRPIFLPIFLSQLSQGSKGSVTQPVLVPTKHLVIPYDASNRTVFLSLIAETQSSIPYNYNNTQYGHMIVYVPANWTIDLTFTNQEGITHNAVLIKPDVTIPTYNLASDGIVIAQIPENAIEGNFLVSGQSGSVLVTNLLSGTYWIACAMSFPTPHAESGMWVILQVSTAVSTPYFTILS
ncbi:MAG TPA: sulfocyanin-like copper-binding protein [Candidatus Saccharimonadales bacterium]|nr:sulfocyanin-like copper-binding protein [Candidatus Saccharimonadales bacterium]